MIAEGGFPARCIKNALEVPRLGYLDRIPLLVTGSSLSADELQQRGASNGRLGWSIPRSAEVDLDGLESVLPRYARRCLTPEIVDLIPSSAWHASLANILTPASWKAIRLSVTTEAGGCELCGERKKLECHESWAYCMDSSTATLSRFMSVCGPCHETRHLGLARIRGRFTEVWGRLVAMNRLSENEAARYADIVQSRFVERSRKLWALDLTSCSSFELVLKRKFQIGGDQLVVGEGPNGHLAISLRGVTLVAAKGGLIRLVAAPQLPDR